MIEYIQNNYSEILTDLGQHIWLALVPVVLGVIFALPVGYLAVRRGWLYQPIVNLGGVLYSIPSLALFLIMPAILGTGTLSPLNIVVSLAVYTFALLTRTVADALLSVQGQATQAAEAMGFRPFRQLLQVELPMALPVMLAGVRVATVANISLVSVGALIGVGGLGALFTRGLQLGFMEPIIVGIVLSVLLAAVCDIAIVLLQRRLTPWDRVATR
ncbi:MAG: ABC transporter permease [Nocardioidaceae bacterium]|nr:ABC transporter permease [Nocardioidaceae bacterium]NUS51407.1 ABC transporter permease [Nocardioidaceae bacterium]